MQSRATSIARGEASTMRRALAMTVFGLAVLVAEPVLGEPLKMHNNRLFLQVKINGVPAEALLDTAAEMTFVDPRLAAELGLKPEGSEMARGSGGKTQVQFAKNVTIEAAGVKLPAMTVALLDMEFLAKKLVDADLRIVLGREFFDAGRVEIDMAGGQIRKADPSVVPEGVKRSLASHRGIESFPCAVEGVDTECDIDIGNGSEVLIGKAFAEQHGLSKPERIVAKKEGGGIGGAVTRDIVTLSKIEVGGVTFEKVAGAIDPMPTAGAVNVGNSVLKHFVLTIDYPGRAVWFKPR
jgi:hypothetical protein